MSPGVSAGDRRRTGGIIPRSAAITDSRTGIANPGRCITGDIEGHIAPGSLRVGRNGEGNLICVATNAGGLGRRAISRIPDNKPFGDTTRPGTLPVAAVAAIMVKGVNLVSSAAGSSGKTL